MFQQPKDKVRASGSRAGDSFWQEEKAAGNFGLKMMAGMGWEQGKGLGKNEDGQKQYLRAKYKADSKGIGATEKQEDATWRVTQDLYSEMLQRVKAEQAAAAAAAAAAGASGSPSPTNEVSLEVTETTTSPDGSNTTTTISQRIRTKTLYSRFKKSKDTANYSATAMSEIFGRKPDPATMQVGIWGKPGTSAVRDSRTPKTEAETKVKKEEPAAAAASQGNENLSTSKLSIRDYFAAKLAAAGKLGNMSAAQFAGKEETKIKTEAMDEEDDQRHGGLGLGHASAAAQEAPSSSARGFTEDQQESYYARMMATAIGGKGVSTGRSARVGLGFGGAGYGANAPASSFTSGPGAPPATSALIQAKKSIKLTDDCIAPMRIDPNLAATIDDERAATSPVAAYEEELVDAAAVNEHKQHKKEKKRKRAEKEAEAAAAAAAEAAPVKEEDEKAAKKARKAAKREAEARAAAEAAEAEAAAAAAAATASAVDSDAERKEAKKAKKAAKRAQEAKEAEEAAAAAAAAAAEADEKSAKKKKKKSKKEESD